MARRRILIALDPAAPRGDALEAVIALGHGTQVELSGVFIEDDNLQRFATLPGAREVRVAEVRLAGYAPQALDTRTLRRQLDACAREFERAFEQARRRLQTEISFRVLRGDVLTELRRAAAEVDVLVIGRSLKSAGLRTWLGIPPERLVEAVANAPAPGNVLFVHEPWATGRSVLLLSDGSEAAGRARDLARSMAETEGLPLVRCMLAGSAMDPEEPGSALISDLDGLRRLCAEVDPRLLLLPDTAGVRERIDLRELLGDLPASVAIVR